MVALNIVDRSVSRILLIDDKANVRELYDDAVWDLGVKTEEIFSVPSLMEFLSGASANDGVICDFHLTSPKYSSVNGDVIVSSLYKKGVPAVLCSFDADTAHSVRRFRHAIPRILTPRELNSAAVVEAFTTCVKEFSGNYSVDRKPWPTLVRFEELLDHRSGLARVLITLPGWDPKMVIDIEISKDDIPFYDDIVTSLESEVGFRCKAKVNLDAKDVGGLYVKDWVDIR